jgi:hypothetical protein
MPGCDLSVDRGPLHNRVRGEGMYHERLPVLDSPQREIDYLSVRSILECLALFALLGVMVGLGLTASRPC